MEEQLFEQDLLVNRAELLFPDNKMLKDIRLIHSDGVIQSLFRVLEHFYDDTDEFRKAIAEQQPRAIMKFMGGDPFHFPRKYDLPTNAPTDRAIANALTENDAIWDTLRLLTYFQPSRTLDALKSFYVNRINIDMNCVSRGQLISKHILIKPLQECGHLGTVFMCCGWYGILGTMFYDNNIKLTKIRSFDIDSNVIPIADRFNQPWLLDDWKFKAVTQDIRDIDFTGHTYEILNFDGKPTPQKDTPDTIINTSCEHIDGFDKWYDTLPKGILLVLQSNDYSDHEDHVNTHKTYDDFKQATPMSEVKFESGIRLPQYHRWTRIGYK